MKDVKHIRYMQVIKVSLLDSHSSGIIEYTNKKAKKHKLLFILFSSTLQILIIRLKPDIVSVYRG